MTLAVHKWYNFDPGDKYFGFLKDIPLIGTAINDIDGSALDNLRRMLLAQPYDIWGEMQGTFCRKTGQPVKEAASAARVPANWGNTTAEPESEESEK